MRADEIEAGYTYSNHDGRIHRRVVRIFQDRPRRGKPALWLEFEVTRNQTRRSFDDLTAITLRRFAARFAAFEVKDDAGPAAQRLRPGLVDSFDGATRSLGSLT